MSVDEWDALVELGRAEQRRRDRLTVATACLQGMLSNGDAEGWFSPEGWASRAAALADALLAHLDETEQHGR